MQLDAPTATLMASGVGVASAVATSFLKDFVFVRWHRRFEKSSDEFDVLRLYVAPLAGISAKLIWRFSEIFLFNRPQFLKNTTLPLVYNEYKRQSTLYRIATLLGWMRAIRLELDALPKGGMAFSNTIEKSLEGVRGALADGPKVEILRLNKLLDVWDLGAANPGREGNLAADLERRLYSKAGDKLKHDASWLCELGREEKVEICRELADFLCNSLGKKKISQPVLEEKIESAIAGMSFREALIYRDWQDAIGDSMLLRDKDSDRRFTVIGFAKFCELLEEETLWMDVFRNSIIDIDFENVDSTDYRATQIHELSVAVCDIVIALSTTQHSDLVDAELLSQAQKLKAHPKI